MLDRIFRRTLFSVAVLALHGATALRAQAPAPTAVMLAAGVVPGQRMRVTLRVPADSAIAAANQRQIEGALIDLDSAGVTLHLEDGSERRIGRNEAEEVGAYAGRSHWLGLLAGWLASLPPAYLACRDAKYECGEGSAIGLGGMILGSAIGWPRWKEVHFP